MSWFGFKKKKTALPTGAGHSGAFKATTVWSGWLTVHPFGKKAEKKRYCILRNDNILYAYKDVSHSGVVKFTIDLTGNVQVTPSDEDTRFSLLCGNTLYSIVCDSGDLASRWIQVLQKHHGPTNGENIANTRKIVSVASIDVMSPMDAPPLSQNVSESVASATIEEMLKNPDNRFCADCGLKGVAWASWSIGVFLCVKCAGHHRGLGTHVSKVKSLSLDTWASDQLQMLKTKGNEYNRQIYEVSLPTPFVRPTDGTELREFITHKYVDKAYVKGGSGVKKHAMARAVSAPPPRAPDDYFDAGDDDVPVLHLQPTRPSERRQTNPFAIDEPVSNGSAYHSPDPTPTDAWNTAPQSTHTNTYTDAFNTQSSHVNAFPDPFASNGTWTSFNATASSFATTSNAWGSDSPVTMRQKTTGFNVDHSAHRLTLDEAKAQFGFINPLAK